jgi:two-component system chemotaxis response regulator CheY
MVVDDNESIRRGLSLVLRDAGYRAILASDGCEALEASELAPPDLILLDMSMPGMDGLTLLESVRNQAGWESLPVLVYSAVEDDYVRRRAAQLGAGFVTKGTVTWDELVTQGRQQLTHIPVASSAKGSVDE